MPFWQSLKKEKGHCGPLCFLGLLVLGLIVFFESIYYV